MAISRDTCKNTFCDPILHNREIGPHVQFPNLFILKSEGPKMNWYHEIASTLTYKKRVTKYGPFPVSKIFFTFIIEIEIFDLIPHKLELCFIL